MRPKAGETVVDVGANIGVFSMWSAHLVGSTGRVLAVEPNPLAAEYASRNLIDQSNVTVVQAACGSEAATATLSFPPGRLSVGSLYLRPDRTESVVVDVRPLDAVLDEAGQDAVDFLKVDVEGHELEVLAGAKDTLSRTRRAALEVDTVNLQRVEQIMQSHGLRLTNTYSGMWHLHTSTIACFSRA